MPTIIDSLVVEFSLDPSKFTKGQKAAFDAFKKMVEDSRKGGKEIENSGKSIAESFSKVQGKLLAVGALFLGGVGVKEFITNTTKADAANNRLTYTLGTNIQTLTQWQTAAKLAGGNADGVTQSISGMIKEFQQFSLTGESSALPYFRAMSIDLADAAGKMRPFDDILRDMARWAEGKEPAKVAAMFGGAGVNQDLLNLLIKGGSELERYLRIAKELNTTTAAQGEEARKTEQAMVSMWEAMESRGRKVLNALAPELQSFFSYYQHLFSDGTLVKKGSLGDKIFSTLNGKSDASTWKSSSASTPSSASGAFQSQEDKEAFIRAYAAKVGISPDQAMAVSRSEGFKDYVGDRNSSFGAYQLHYGGVASGGMAVPGLGDAFTKKTGLDARNKETEREQIQFALDYAAAHGWSSWHGWKGDNWAGITPGAGAAAAAVASGSRGGSRSTSTTDTKIDTINVYTQATDAKGVAQALKPAIERNSMATQADGGPN